MPKEARHPHHAVRVDTGLIENIHRRPRQVVPENELARSALHWQKLSGLQIELQIALRKYRRPKSHHIRKARHTQKIRPRSPLDLRSLLAPLIFTGRPNRSLPQDRHRFL